MQKDFARLALIGIVLALIIGIFAYLGGWLTPKRLTPGRLTDGFETVDGIHPGFRRNHAKGIGVSGFFESNGKGERLSKASVFRSGRVPVIGRFSLSGGHPYAADKPDTVRGLGLEFSLPGGELWRTAMINLPVFPFRTPAAFYEHLLATKPDPKTGKPDPVQLKTFLAGHPETVRAMKIIQSRPFSSGFGDSGFYSLNAFRFLNSAGDSVPVRWVFTPARQFEAASATTVPDHNDYLFNDLITQIRTQPLQWHLILIIGQPGDPTNDATREWPEGREKVDAGILTLDRFEAEATSPATNINFDPLVLPAGITPSGDPLLSPRSAVYSQSYTRRTGETKQPAEVRKVE